MIVNKIFDQYKDVTHLKTRIIYFLSLFIIFETSSLSCKIFTRPSDTYILEERLNLRMQPEISKNNSLVVVPKYAIVELIDKNGPSTTNNGVTGEWWKVKFRDFTGWIFSPYLKRVNPSYHRFVKVKSTPLFKENSSNPLIINQVPYGTIIELSGNTNDNSDNLLLARNLGGYIKNADVSSTPVELELHKMNLSGLGESGVDFTTLSSSCINPDGGHAGSMNFIGVKLYNNIALAHRNTSYCGDCQPASYLMLGTYSIYGNKLKLNFTHAIGETEVIEGFDQEFRNTEKRITENFDLYYFERLKMYIPFKNTGDLNTFSDLLFDGKIVSKDECGGKLQLNKGLERSCYMPEFSDYRKYMGREVNFTGTCIREEINFEFNENWDAPLEKAKFY